MAEKICAALPIVAFLVIVALLFSLTGHGIAFGGSGAGTTTQQYVPPEPTIAPYDGPTPQSGPADALVLLADPKATQAAQVTLVVQKGDTLSQLAARYGTSVAAIQKANHLGTSTLIIVGQKLVIPAA